MRMTPQSGHRFADKGMRKTMMRMTPPFAAALRAEGP